MKRKRKRGSWVAWRVTGRARMPEPIIVAIEVKVVTGRT